METVSSRSPTCNRNTYGPEERTLYRPLRARQGGSRAAFADIHEGRRLQRRRRLGRHLRVREWSRWRRRTGLLQFGDKICPRRLLRVQNLPRKHQRRAEHNFGGGHACVLSRGGSQSQPHNDPWKVERPVWTRQASLQRILQLPVTPFHHAVCLWMEGGGLAGVGYPAAGTGRSKRPR
jgi:hypothetical protein